MNKDKNDQEMTKQSYLYFSYQTFTEELLDDSGTEDLGSIKFSIHISSDLSHTPPPDVSYVDVKE